MLLSFITTHITFVVQGTHGFIDLKQSHCIVCDTPPDDYWLNKTTDSTLQAINSYCYYTATNNSKDLYRGQHWAYFWQCMSVRSISLHAKTWRSLIPGETSELSRKHKLTGNKAINILLTIDWVTLIYEYPDVIHSLQSYLSHRSTVATNTRSVICSLQLSHINLV